jgi:adenylyltransferase/sulfurtransferase
VLAGIGASGQAKLRAASVLVIGAGGLGVPVLSYLAGAGVGRLGIVDGDRLEPSNLHRQTLYALADCGQPKAALAAARLLALNPELHADVHFERLSGGNAARLVTPYDVIVDCTDNFATKFLLNDVAQRLGKPLVLASVYQYEGQLQVVRADRRGACLRCVWPEATRDGLVGNCAEAGVLGPVPGVFGSLQALETLKLLLDLPGQLRDDVLLFDLTTFAVSRVRARRLAACAGGECVRAGDPGDATTAAPEVGVEVEFDSLEAALEAGYEILDVREPAEIADLPTPAPRSRQLPVAIVLKDSGNLDPTVRWLVVCARGGRSLAVTRELRARGFHRAESLRGGLLGLSPLPA